MEYLLYLTFSFLVMAALIGDIYIYFFFLAGGGGGGEGCFFFIKPRLLNKLLQNMTT